MRNTTRIIIGLIGLFSSIPSFALSVGVTAGPHAVIMEEVKKECEKKGVSVKVIEFNDFILPNAALAQGDIDVNCYQHQPFLDDQVKSRGYKIASVAKTIILPLGIYSTRHKSLDSLAVGAKVAIPNDPTNGGRALLLLKKAGLIELKQLENPSILDISQNSKKLKIVEIEAPQLPRTLDDVDFSVINTDWILVSGLDPSKAVYREGIDSPYANILVIRKGDESRADIKILLDIYKSKHIREFILKRYNGNVLPAW
jgi:D-methionine transport system substrate-binding protein